MNLNRLHLFIHVKTAQLDWRCVSGPLKSFHVIILAATVNASDSTIILLSYRNPYHHLL